MDNSLTGKNRNMSYEANLGISEECKLLRTLKSEPLYSLWYEINFHELKRTFPSEKVAFSTSISNC